MKDLLKTCTKCRKKKPNTDFYPKRGKCKTCYKETYGYLSIKRKELLERLPNTLTKEEEYQLMVDSNFNCMLSGVGGGINLDHFVPLALGELVLEYGLGGTTYENIIPISATLNQSKQSRNPFEWFEKARVKYHLDSSLWNQVVQYMADKNQMTSIQYKNRINACYKHDKVIKWAENLNESLSRASRNPKALLRQAIRKGINIDVVIKKYGNQLSVEYIKSQKEYINEVKLEYVERGGLEFTRQR
ncbi:hypothetical protein ACIQZI_13265 [Peribacillus sp. NPDC096379]|uniref:hypothetical protein n=1 Tax=Peribacillus sp. NPDC096379 TaxID=3364393 RepID=UPI003826F231